MGAFKRRLPRRCGKRKIPALDRLAKHRGQVTIGQRAAGCAKLHEALIYDQRGEREREAQTVNVVKTLYPEMGGAEMKQRFLDVLKRNE